MNNIINLIFQFWKMKNSTNTSQEFSVFCDRDFPIFESFYSDNVPYLAAVLLISTTGCIGNIVTVIVISCWRKLHTPTFTMIACLAASDAYSLLSYTLHTYTHVWDLLKCNFMRGSVYARYYGAIWMTLFCLGRYNPGMQLCILACLRFTAIVQPLKFKTYCTCKAVIAMSVAGAGVVFILSIVYIILMHGIGVIANRCVHYIVINAVNFILPTFIFTLLHRLKLRALRQSPSLKNNTSVKMNVVVSMVLLIYVMSSASLLVSDIYACFTTHPFADLSFLINCAVNPFIYFFSSPPILQLFQKMWNRICHKYQVTQNGNTPAIEMN